MKSDTILLKNDVCQSDIENVLSQVEKVAEYGNLNKKQSLSLRLLAEELLGFEKGIVGFSNAEFHIENKGNEYKLFVHSDVKLEAWRKEQVIDMSSSGKNAAYKGFKGKLRFVVDAMFEKSEYSEGMMDYCEYLLESVGEYAPDYYDKIWSMNEYKDEVKENSDEWDMMEHSILANLADELIVAVRNNFLDILIVKKL